MPESIRSLSLDFPPLRKSLSATDESPLGILSSFLVGKENEEVLEVVSPESILMLGERSPLLFYGGSGVGKTTLSLLVAGRWSLAVEQKQLSILSGGDFARQYASAAEADDMERFRTKYRRCKLLLIDGVHELVGREGAQDELLHTMDDLLSRKQPLILTAPKLPGAIRGLKSSLASRMMSGVSLEIHPPGKEARMQILVELNRALGASLTIEELHKLVAGLPVTNTAVQLKGVMLQWLHQQRVAQEPRGDALKQVIDNQQRASIPSIQDIARLVAKSLGVKPSELKLATRKSNIVRARGLAMYLARQWTGMSLQQIGEFFGGRDHTTVLHACRKTESDLALDNELQRAVDEVKQQV